MAAPFGGKKIGIWDCDVFKKDFERVGDSIPFSTCVYVCMKQLLFYAGVFFL